VQVVHPTLVSKFAGKVVNAVRCGELHTLAVVEGSSLFATGDNLHGQLGFGDVKCRMSFQEVHLSFLH
jgi:alpha-tubulin suppressor-like RCC1 family protein